MSTADIAISRRVTMERSLRGKRVDVPGLAFQLALLVSLLACLAIIVTLIWQVVSDGSGTYAERGFVISNWPEQIGATIEEVVTFLVEPIGVMGWIFSILVLLGLPLGIYAAFRSSTRFGLVVVGILTGAIVFTGLLQTSDFLTSNLSRSSDRAGIAQPIFGSLVLAGIVVVVSMPLGIATAVYLEEYARDNRFTRFVRLNIRNLAGVPSVVYGVLGLALFVQFIGTDIGEMPLIGGFMESIFGSGGITGGKTIIAGGLTLSVVVLPIVIITASESLRAVPQSLREGGYGVGATKWEVQRTLVLPNAFAGILTGTILSVSRAIGETAPLILVGAFYGTFFTTGNATFWDKFGTTYTALPQVVYQWAAEPSEEFKVSLTAAAIMALLAVTLMCNIAAVLMRNHYEKRW
jgi:phosphate transport system permease protein